MMRRVRKLIPMDRDQKKAIDVLNRYRPRLTQHEYETLREQVKTGNVVRALDGLWTILKQRGARNEKIYICG